MPVTPLHFGVGMVGKGLFPSRVSLTAFVVSQFVVDMEVAYYMLVRHEWPFHRWAHTFVGGTALGVVAGVAVHFAATVLAAFLGSRWQVPDLREAAWAPASAGGVLGGLTHPLLDGVIHDGIAPLRPFSSANPLHGAVSMSVLRLALVALAAGGGLVLARVARGLVGETKPGTE